MVLSGSGGDWSVSLFVAEEMDVAAMFSRVFFSLSPLSLSLESVSKVVGEGETLGEKGSWRVSQRSSRELQRSSWICILEFAAVAAYIPVTTTLYIFSTPNSLSY